MLNTYTLIHSCYVFLFNLKHQMKLWNNNIGHQQLLLMPQLWDLPIVCMLRVKECLEIQRVADQPGIGYRGLPLMCVIVIT